MRVANADVGGARRLIASTRDAPDDWRDLTDALNMSTVADLMASGPLDEVAVVPDAPRVPDGFSFLAPLAASARVFCAGFNYRQPGRAAQEHPTIFLRHPRSFVAHEQPVLVPRVSEQLDWEGEIAVVIGQPCRHATAESALRAVAGFACLADNTVRDWARHGTQATAGKNFDATGAIGPWIASSGSVPDMAQLEMITKVNGVRMQHGRMADLVFGVAELIGYVSTFTTLLPGDVVATGTPPGIGARRQPPVWLRPGDTVEVTVAGVGSLRNAVVDEPGAPA